MGAQYGAATHVGCVREHNEDCYVADPERGIWIVADGMGGHRAGEVASRIAVDFIHEELVRGRTPTGAISGAHAVVARAAADGLGQRGMGSTSVALQLHARRFRIAWVGDSRAYRWDGRHLWQLTRDHSLVQRMLDEGHISSAEAAVHPYRNVITQALGAEDLAEVQVDEVSGDLQDGELLLLCSDGLSSEVALADMEEVLDAPGDLQAKAQALVQAALERGGRDNITVLLIGAPAEAVRSGPDRREDEPTGKLDLHGE